jgi:hypothetical protein
MFHFLCNIFPLVMASCEKIIGSPRSISHKLSHFCNYMVCNQHYEFVN